MLSSAIRVAREYERGVIFSVAGWKSPPKGLDLFLLIPIIDKMVRVDLQNGDAERPAAGGDHEGQRAEP